MSSTRKNQIFSINLQRKYFNWWTTIISQKHDGELFLRFWEAFVTTWNLFKSDKKRFRISAFQGISVKSFDSPPRGRANITIYKLSAQFCMLLCSPCSNIRKCPVEHCIGLELSCMSWYHELNQKATLTWGQNRENIIAESSRCSIRVWFTCRRRHTSVWALQVLPSFASWW